MQVRMLGGIRSKPSWTIMELGNGAGRETGPREFLLVLHKWFPGNLLRVAAQNPPHSLDPS